MSQAVVDFKESFIEPIVLSLNSVNTEAGSYQTYHLYSNGIVWRISVDDAAT